MHGWRAQKHAIILLTLRLPLIIIIWVLPFNSRHQQRHQPTATQTPCTEFMQMLHFAFQFRSLYNSAPFVASFCTFPIRQQVVLGNFLPCFPSALSRSTVVGICAKYGCHSLHKVPLLTLASSSSFSYLLSLLSFTPLPMPQQHNSVYNS